MEKEKVKKIDLGEGETAVACRKSATKSRAGKSAGHFGWLVDESKLLSRTRRLAFRWRRGLG